MAAEEEFLDWGVFHDGDIASISVAGESLLFKIEIDYLARRATPTTSYFTVKTDKVKWIRYESYSGEVETEISKIEKLQPEILSFKSEGDVRVIECSEGILSIEYSTEEIFDDKKNRITVETIYGVARRYWDSFGNGDERE